MSRFKEFLDETVSGKLPKGWDKESVVKLGKSLGISPGDKGFFDACVAKFDNEMGSEKAKGFCANIKDVFYNSEYWRGKGKSKADIERDTKANPLT
jgi:hypothetical protein